MARIQSGTIRQLKFPFYCLLLLAAFLSLACVASGLLTGGNATPVSKVTPTNPLGIWFAVYFTAPGRTAFGPYRGGPDAALAQAIDHARLTIDAAIYDLNLWSIRDALIAAHQRGVQVRIVTESDFIDGAEMRDLVAAGIPVLGDRREGLMHNKFVVIDRLDVWTGSMNWTVNGAYRNDNNLVHIRSTRLAENYSVEFDEMFLEDRFGNGSPANTPYPVIRLNGSQIECYFSPDDHVASHIIGLIQGAQTEIQFMAFSFTSDEIAQALIERANAGVSVLGILESGQAAANIGGEYEHLRSQGIDVHLDGNPQSMHHKVLILDGETVITGSYNFSRSAEVSNDENVLVIHSPQAAEAYQAAFENIFAQAQP